MPGQLQLPPPDAGLMPRTRQLWPRGGIRQVGHEAGGGSSPGVTKIFDDFPGVALNPNWAADIGSGNESVGAGDLTFSAAPDFFYRTDANYGDSTYDLWTTIGPDTSGAWGLFAKKSGSFPADDFLAVEVDTGGTELRLITWRDFGPAYPGASLFGSLSLVSGQSVWIRAIISGNDVTAGVWDGDPDGAGNVILAPSTLTLSGADATDFGTGVMGSPGIIFVGDPASFAFHYFRWA